VIRAGIRSLLENIEGMEVVAEANDGREALEFVKQHAPDNVLTYIAIPRLKGLEAIPRLKNFNTNLHLPILLLQTSEEYIREALRVGARGNVVKCADPSELELASNLSYEERFTSPPANGKFFNSLRKGGQPKTSHDSSTSVLKPLKPTGPNP